MQQGVEERLSGISRILRKVMLLEVAGASEDNKNIVENQKITPSNENSAAVRWSSTLYRTAQQRTFTSEPPASPLQYGAHKEYPD